ncbi:MAG TPA: exodeoxyribonuclease VII large subunit [Gemmatimonadaceae bacterium]|nr:exodeoxyribonuclease VII large subunit [Gemmatimonadaceae bacterium]
MKRGSRRPAPPQELLQPQLFPVAEPPRAYGPRSVMAAAMSLAVPQIPGASPESAISVELLTQQARDVIEGAFPRIWIRGEISDFKSYRSGHWYFCLRGASAQIKCVMWSRDQRAVPAVPEDGMQVVVLGQPTVYPVQGSLQCTIYAIDAVGDGLWRKALDESTARLRADGLLEPSRKRALPRFPRRVAVITSPDGAALRDIISVMRRRCPTVEIVLIPAKVQGDGAPADLARAIDCVARWGQVDTVIIGRGGGAREDLWAFNSEVVARALAGCVIPTISAVGHEVDITLCDLVADHRAATPSAAAEAAVPVLAEVKAEAAAMLIALREALVRHVQRRRDRVERATHDLHVGVTRGAERRSARMSAIAGKLHALSPLATLARGYAVARDASGATLASTSAFAPGVDFDLLLRDGTVRATTRSVEEQP